MVTVQLLSLKRSSRPVQLCPLTGCDALHQVKINVPVLDTRGTWFSQYPGNTSFEVSVAAFSRKPAEALDSSSSNLLNPLHRPRQRGRLWPIPAVGAQGHLQGVCGQAGGSGQGVPMLLHRRGEPFLSQHPRKDSTQVYRLDTGSCATCKRQNLHQLLPGTRVWIPIEEGS
jgi:hypothetical protein